jgi:serine/threonine protein kinase
LDEPIGAGGMGDVWRGVDLRLRRQVAIKIRPADLAANQSAVEPFRWEAETTAGLQHPGITVTFDIDEHQDGQDHLIFLVIELLTGRDLGAVLARARSRTRPDQPRPRACGVGFERGSEIRPRERR